MRLLIIEDNVLLANSIRRNLEDEGFVVEIALDGEEGLYCAKNWVYDCIVLDLMLPKMNGQQVLESFRRESNVPVIVVSSRETTSERIKLLEAGADDYMVKPIDVDELCMRIRALIRRSGGYVTGVIKLGDIELDMRENCVKKGGKAVELTLREYQILHLLAKRNKRTVEYRVFDEYIFGVKENDGPRSNTLQVHIHSIRRKLGRSIIRSVHGQGYRLESS